MKSQMSIDCDAIVAAYDCEGLVRWAVSRTLRELEEYLEREADCDATYPADVAQVTDATQMLNEMLPDVMFHVEKWFRARWADERADHVFDCDKCRRERMVG